MEKTDLKKTGVGDITGKIVIVQLAGVHDKTFAYEEVLKDATNLRSLIHTGLLRYNNYFESNPFYGFKECGGRIQVPHMSDTPEWFQKALIGDDVIPITCTNPECDMHLRIHYSKAVIKNVMLHLILKQMFPDSASFNYLDCSAYEFDDHFSVPSEDVKSVIEKLGLISMIPSALWGIVGSEKEHFGHFDLGFTLSPGTKTLKSFDGFDRWARFLIQKKEEQLKEFLTKEAFPALLGPKSPRD